MFYSREGVGPALLLWSCSLAWLLCDVKGYWDNSSHLHCAPNKMELSFSISAEDVAFVLGLIQTSIDTCSTLRRTLCGFSNQMLYAGNPFMSIGMLHGHNYISQLDSCVDFQDEFQHLENDSACGLWVGQRPNNTMVIGAAYDGCYVREVDEEYMMVLLLEENGNDTVEQQHKMEKKCPIQNEAMDAPSPDICSAVSQANKLACAETPVTRDICEAMGCCYSPNDATMPCFFGNKLTTQCSVDNSMVIAVSKDLTKPSLLLNSVHVIGLDKSSCSQLSVATSDSFAVFRFPLSCANAYEVPGSPMTYETTIEAVRGIQTWQGSSITRDSTMRVTVRCSYIQTGTIPLAVTVKTLPPPLPVSTSGPLELEMRIAQDLAYGSYYSEGDYPVVKVLREPVYLEVRIIRRTDPNLVLVLDDCWATNSADPTLLPQWPILFDSCPFDGDNYISKLISVGTASQAVPLPKYYKRFLVNTFTFDSSTQLALEGLVYFHCSASVCVPSTMDNCVASCGLRKRRMVKHKDLMSLKNTVTSQGPVAFISEHNVEVLKLEGTNPSQYSTLDLVRALVTAGGVGSVAVAVLGLWMRCRRQNCNFKTNA